MPDDGGKRWQFRTTPFLTPPYPELGTGPIPIEPYRSPAYFEREMARIFRRVWLCVGRQEEMPESGSYLVRDIAGMSAVVVRQPDGSIRAFHNICSHRATRLLLGPKGRVAGAFTCMFHAWSYAVSGELIGVPDESMFFDLDRAKCGLQGVACDLWNGWVFVNLDPAPAQSLADWLGAFGRRLGTYPFQEFASVAAWRTEVRANWKVGMDAFQESYHVTGTHGGSLARLFLSKDNPFGHCAAAELDEPHRMHTIVTGGEEYKLSPAAKLAFDFGTGGATVRTRQAGMVPPECNPSSAPNWAFDVHVFFPNFFIDIVADGFFTHQFWPVAADRSIFETRRYYRPADHAGQLYAQELSKAMFRDVAIEDCATIELTQQGISSGARQQLLFGDQELLCRHQYHVVEQYLAGTEP